MNERQRVESLLAARAKLLEREDEHRKKGEDGKADRLKDKRRAQGLVWVNVEAHNVDTGLVKYEGFIVTATHSKPPGHLVFRTASRMAKGDCFRQGWIDANGVRPTTSDPLVDEGATPPLEARETFHQTALFGRRGGKLQFFNDRVSAVLARLGTLALDGCDSVASAARNLAREVRAEMAEGTAGPAALNGWHSAVADLEDRHGGASATQGPPGDGPAPADSAGGEVGPADGLIPGHEKQRSGPCATADEAGASKAGHP